MAATCWINEVETKLTDGAQNAEATRICFDIPDVYVAGYDGAVAGYWKNTAALTLAQEGKVASMFVDRKDIYLAGAADNKPVYWKNAKEE